MFLWRVLCSLGGFFVFLEGSLFPWRVLCSFGGFFVPLEGSLFPWRVLCFLGGFFVPLEGSLFSWRVLCSLGGFFVSRASMITNDFFFDQSFLTHLSLYYSLRKVTTPIFHSFIHPFFHFLNFCFFIHLSLNHPFIHPPITQPPIHLFTHPARTSMPSTTTCRSTPRTTFYRLSATSTSSLTCPPATCCPSRYHSPFPLLWRFTT